jgi:hypothetical protein
MAQVRDRPERLRREVPFMECRPGCAACCIAPSISSSIPGMEGGKPAGACCVQLDSENRCRIFGQSDRPAVCVNLQPSPGMCGENAAEAMAILGALERVTRPSE